MGGHIQKTDGWRWRIDYRDGHGRRHRATFDRRKEADKALTEIKTRFGKGEYVASKLIPTFQEIAEDWFRSTSDRRPGTVGSWRAQLDLYLLPKLGNLRLDRIDVGVIENLHDELRAKLSAKNVNAVLTTTAAIFKLAVRRRLVSGNPAADAERAFMGAVELKVMAEAPVTEVRGLLGHFSPAVTLKVYSHWFRNVESDSLDKLARTLLAGSKNVGHFLDTFKGAVEAKI